MDKEKYVRAELEILRFKTGDILTGSSENPDDEYELDRDMIRLPLI